MNRLFKQNGFSFPITSLAGSSFGNLLKTLKSHKISPKYRGRLGFTLLISLVLEPFRLWEDLIWGWRIKKYRIKDDPVFIIGFWRSGTTLLHNYLCQDPKSGFVNTFQTVFPHVLLSHYRWIRFIANIFMPARRPFDGMKMDLEYPQEEEIALANVQQLSFYKFWYFPNDFEEFFKNDLFFEQTAPGKLRRWENEYTKLIKKALIFTKGQRFTSKNPSNMARIKLLLKMFPGARFIYIYRDPYRVIESVANFSKAVLPAIELQLHDPDQQKKKFLNLYKKVVNHYQSEKEFIPEGQIFEISYESFLENQIESLQNIYKALHLNGFDEALPHFLRYQQEAGKFKKRAYNISPETKEMVQNTISDLIP